METIYPLALRIYPISSKGKLVFFPKATTKGLSHWRNWDDLGRGTWVLKHYALNWLAIFGVFSTFTFKG